MACVASEGPARASGGRVGQFSCLMLRCPHDNDEIGDNLATSCISRYSVCERTL